MQNGKGLSIFRKTFFVMLTSKKKSKYGVLKNLFPVFLRITVVQVAELTAPCHIKTKLSIPGQCQICSKHT